MAIKDFYPTIRPTLDLNFSGSRMIDPRITFSRSGTGSIASYFDEKGVMKFAPQDTPRIDFDPVTGECLGLLIEEQRTNLLAYSSEFDNAAWVKSQVTISANSGLAPDGTTTADKLVESATTSTQHYIEQLKTFAGSSDYAASVFVSASGRTSFDLTFSRSSAWQDQGLARFNLQTGTVTTNANGKASIQYIGNGIYKCSIVGTKTATTEGAYLRLTIVGSSDSTTYVGDGVSGLNVWGAQVSAGSFPTSYIPTTSAQVTRAADTASMTGANFSSWISAVGTILVKYKKSGWQHNNTPPSTQLDLAKYIQDYSTAVVIDAIERVMFYPRQLTEVQISALKG